MIIRSSSAMEDTAGYSNAGKFESILDVLPDKGHIDKAVRKVYASYGTSADQQILVQPMLQNIKKSGEYLLWIY